MKSTLIASIPALIVLFGLAFGFVTFHLIAQNAEATGAECNYLEYNCRQERETQQMRATVIMQSGVKMHRVIECRFVDEYFNTCQIIHRNRILYFNLSR